MNGGSASSLRRWLNSQELSFDQFASWVDTFPLLSIDRHAILQYHPHVPDNREDESSTKKLAARRLAALLKYANSNRATMSETQIAGYQLILEEIRSRTGVFFCVDCTGDFTAGAGLLVIPSSAAKCESFFGLNRILGPARTYLLLEWAASDRRMAGWILTRAILGCIGAKAQSVQILYSTRSKIHDRYARRLSEIIRRLVPNCNISIEQHEGTWCEPYVVSIDVSF